MNIKNISLVSIIVMLLTQFISCKDEQIEPPAPIITAISPTSALPGSEVIITGLHFSATASQNAVQINSVATTITAATATQLTVTVPANATTGPVSVTVNNRSVSGPVFTVLEPQDQNPVDEDPGDEDPVDEIPTLVITSFSPTSGYAGDDITLTGSNFGATPEDNIVSINGIEAEVKAVTATTLTFTIPASATSSKVSLTVNGISVLSETTLTILYPPVITSFETVGGVTPTSGVAGTLVLIHGTHFRPVIAENIVMFGDKRAQVTQATTQLLRVLVPGGISDGPISVIVNGKTAVSAADFIYVPEANDPIFTAINKSEQVIQGEELIITGQHLMSNFSRAVTRTGGTNFKANTVIISSTDSEIRFVATGGTSPSFEVGMEITKVQGAAPVHYYTDLSYTIMPAATGFRFVSIPVIQNNLITFLIGDGSANPDHYTIAYSSYDHTTGHAVEIPAVIHSIETLSANQRRIYLELPPAGTYIVKVVFNNVVRYSTVAINVVHQ